jgi:uncharacterized protein YeaO (DUF488 family)
MNHTTIRTKRAYDPPSQDDGCRILVDRLWPRGLSKEKAGLDLWMKEIAPSTELRKWYGHEPDKWSEFKRRYFSELDTNSEQLDILAKEMQRGIVTLLYASKEEKLNNVEALKEYLETKVLNQSS